MTLLVGLLVVAYGGSMLMGGRTLRGYGLPSGSEWLVLGFVLGPVALGVVSQQALAVFEPAAGVSTAWLALLSGVECGGVGERRPSLRASLVGIVCALLSASVVALAVFVLATQLLHRSLHDAVVLGAALGVAGSETARQAARWAVSQSDAHGPLARLLERIAAADDLVPMLGLAFLFAWSPSQVQIAGLGPAQWFGVTVLLGVLLGLTCAMLLRTTRSTSDSFGVVLGAALLGAGIAWRLGLSPLTVMFVMGATLSLSTRGGSSLWNVMASTEATVALPTLLLAGALVHPPLSFPVLALLVVTVLSRGVIRGALAALLVGITGAPRAARPAFALGASSTGALTVIIGLACAFRFRGELGDTVLAVSACVTVLGELVGPAALRRALQVGVVAPAADGGAGSDGSGSDSSDSQVALSGAQP